MKAPGFWYAPPGLAAALLAPAAGLWTGVTARRLRQPGWRAPVPVICVGNLVAGGTGKTPVVRALVERLRERGLAAASLSRGHGGRLTGPLPVDPALHDALAVGDEPLLLSRHIPAWIGRDRAAAAQAMVAAGIGGIVLDDGFQNPGLAKDLSLLVIDAGMGFGNGKVIPAGPLREPVAAGLARAQALVLMGDGPAAAPVSALAAQWGLPLLRAHLVPDPGVAAALRGRKVLAFAGIGRPEKFFQTLRVIGAEPVATLPFPDHHPYSGAEMADLLRQADEAGALAVTTEKDAMRLHPDMRAAVTVLPVTVGLAAPALLDALLDRHIGGGQG